MSNWAAVPFSDEIARALCAEGYAQLLASFEPLARIADPALRLRALGHAYVAFGIAHPQTYRLIFMEDPSYTDAALTEAAEASDEAGDASFRLMVDSIDELRAAGRLPAATQGDVWAEALWATMHGVVALKLTCPVFPRTPVDTLIDVAFDAWLGSVQQGTNPHKADAGGETGTAAEQPSPQPLTPAQTEPKPRVRRTRRAAAKPESPVA